MRPLFAVLSQHGDWRRLFPWKGASLFSSCALTRRAPPTTGSPEAARERHSRNPSSASISEYDAPQTDGRSRHHGQRGADPRQQSGESFASRGKGEPRGCSLSLTHR